jgi:hypothetical protein
MSQHQAETIYELVTSMESDFADLAEGMQAILAIGEYARVETDCLRRIGELGQA